MEMQEIATLNFVDLETAADAVAICRARLGAVGICIALREGPYDWEALEAFAAEIVRAR